MRALFVLLAGCMTPTEYDPIEDVNGLPACASAQMTTIFKATRSYIPKGSVSDRNYVTAASTADPHLYLDGPQIFPAFRELIASAKHDVALQTYVWETDSEPAKEIIGGIADLARRRAVNHATTPVIVRFAFDVSTLSYGSRVDALPKAWAAVAALQLDPRYVQFELAGVARTGFGALHKKTLVVDGREAIITGANPQAHHDFAMPWRDAGFRLSGEIAQALEDDFADTWSRAERWTCGGDLAGEWSACSAPVTPMERLEQPLAASDACLPMLAVTRQADPTPSNRIDNPQDQAFLAAFASAERSIHIQTPNLNDDAAKRALVEAVQRGVIVDVVLSKGFNDDSEVLPGQGGTNEQNVQLLYDTLAAAGVANACDKLRFRWHAQGGVAVVGNGAYASHAKYASIDDAIVIVGTANMDTQSWNNSREINVLVDDAALTQAWDAQMFDVEFANGIVVDQCK